jgi:hypothetical protein
VGGSCFRDKNKMKRRSTVLTRFFVWKCGFSFCLRVLRMGAGFFFWGFSLFIRCRRKNIVFTESSALRLSLLTDIVSVRLLFGGGKKDFRHVGCQRNLVGPTWRLCEQIRFSLPSGSREVMCCSHATLLPSLALFSGNSRILRSPLRGDFGHGGAA